MPRRVWDLSEDELDKLLNQTARGFAESGKLVEAGWQGFAHAFDAPPDKAGFLHFVFFAGAHHVYSSLIAMLMKDQEVTEADIDLYQKVGKEMHEFGEVLRAAIRRRGH